MASVVTVLFAFSPLGDLRFKGILDVPEKECHSTILAFQIAIPLPALWSLRQLAMGGKQIRTDHSRTVLSGPVRADHRIRPRRCSHEGISPKPAMTGALIKLGVIASLCDWTISLDRVNGVSVAALTSVPGSAMILFWLRRGCRLAQSTPHG